ncbi:exodeoxyribonuclease VII small subunit [Staphylococcus muscae]|uniref:Exodeoxyribonuclease 7 small subunit n=1 Tax=Staphylococcus muscae TaxID=1294 RepID=A0A240C4K9_9STAP|nr:exodeoxyribonuclease VII small subunit [Staphylococcus muscae]AVQ33105.1 exodeoxyribonuclease VII small subunit [Staphylococcus muscae]PNZ04756.1 exodeoxyribonuclease VII small subunit [Staphylococcus muscae]GGA88330.1 exodeoxyribonuclease 7 small subunit [Staphylococcus muscae]SNW02542.1 exodeoxyribonuclease VII small subunit [Staphylococcus muscae]
MTTDNQSFETMMHELENIVKQLDNDTVSLEESLALYQKGMALSKACEKTLKEAENKVSKLIEDEADDTNESKSE